MKGSSKSPHASSRTSGRRSSKETPDTMLLAQLQQLQLQQLQHHGHLLSYPPMVYPLPTATRAVEAEPGAAVLQQLEVKESRMGQLSALLEAMKHESSTTAEAMHKTLSELQALQQTNTALAAQVERTKEAMAIAEAEHSAQLQQLVLAVESERADARTKFETAMLERQREHDGVRHQLEREAATLRSDKDELAHEVTELTHQCDHLQEQRATLETELKAVVRSADLVKDEYESYQAAMNLKFNELEAEKQELAQHLAATFKDLERARAALVDVNNNAAQLSATLHQNEQSWQRTVEGMERQRGEEAKESAALRATLQAMEEALQVERGQKEELNTAMRSELQRFSDEMLALDTQHSQAAAALQGDLEASQAQLRQATQDIATLHNELQSKAGVTADAMRQLEKTLALKSEALDAYAESNSALENELAQTRTQLRAIEADLDAVHFARRILEDKLQGFTVAWAELSPLVGLAPMENDPAILVAKAKELATLVLERHSLLDAMRQLQLQQTTALEEWTNARSQLELLIAGKDEELASVKMDCTTLAAELQTRAAGQAAEVAALNDACAAKVTGLENAMQATALQSMQLSRSVEAQKARMLQLEEEKRELLHEADQLNRTVDTMFQGKNQLQLELDNVKALLSAAQAELDDLSDAHTQLKAASATDLADLRTHKAALERSLVQEREAGEREAAAKAQQVAHLEADLALLTSQFTNLQAEAATSRQHLVELNDALEAQGRALADATENAAEWKDRADVLTASTANVEGTLKQEVLSYSNQCVALSGDKKRLEVALATMQSQVDLLNGDLQAARSEKRVLQQSLQERDEALVTAQGDAAQSKAEIERLQRTRSNMQTELGRMNDEVNDHLRQLEVLRREFRSQEKAFATQDDLHKKEIESLRHELLEATALNDELQTKMATIQAAANATINDLVAELTHAEEAHKAEAAARAKEDDLLRTQYRYLEEDLKRKEAEWRESSAILKRESLLRKEHLDTLDAKYTKQKEVLEAKKLDVDRVAKEAEQRQFRVAELERKLAPLVNAKETLTERVADLKHTLEAKTRESQELEERLRTEIAKLQKEKRDLEALRARHQDDSERDSLGRFATLQAQLAAENKTLKAHIERYKSDLSDASQNVLTLAQRLEALQTSSSRTISELSAQLQSAEQQYQTQTSALERDLALARDQVTEANVTRQLLQKELRRLHLHHKDEPMASVRTSASVPESRQFTIEAEDDNHIAATARSALQSSDPFDTKASLADIPVALLRAQIGLDLSTPAKGNNQVEGVPHLDFELLKSAGASMPALHLNSSDRHEGDIATDDAALRSAVKKSKSLKLLKGKRQRHPGATDLLPKLV
ncbi:plectin-like protein [Achlya hypogyna]|uniref:Plectin-like protein n=1 Tax=Achlya hypogyna TaxID=1202772 RepID=A0A1V9YZ84_ACHHY|nr:plectin-like protein [Achlya hypogyna]